MALRVKLTQDELDLIDLIEDPVLFGEFMRTTRDASPQKKEWPKHEFRYRWYQKDILTDTSPEIVFTAGRAVGKCSPGSAKVFTYPYGYRTISALVRDKNPIIVLSLNSEGQFIQRIAKIAFNGKQPVFKVITTEGNVFEGTSNHPMLTPNGFVEIKDLRQGDNVAVLNCLPHQSEFEPYTWAELRYIGYIIGSPVPRPEQIITTRYKKQIEELKAISEYFDTRFEVYNNTVVKLPRKMCNGSIPHPATGIIKEMGLHFSWRKLRPFRFNKFVKRLSKNSFKIMLESFFSMYADITNTNVVVKLEHKELLEDIEEILLYFGVQSTLQKEVKGYSLNIYGYDNYCRFFTNFDLPGIKVNNLAKPTKLDSIRYEPIESIKILGVKDTYMVSVPKTENYISDNFLVHNSLIFEDMVLWESVNHDKEFPETKEQLITTANQTQMTPVQDRLILRFTNSPLLSSFLDGNINRSKGTMDFETGQGSVYRINMRIAGSRGENNLVGLHIPRIKIDEAQLFPYTAYVQLEPTWNYWEINKRKFYCGVPTGQRGNNVLYYLDQVSPRTKKYRIPSHENPYYTKEDDNERLIRYQGKESDEYVHLVLGRHGEPTYSVIPYELIQRRPYELYSYRYHQTDRLRSVQYKDLLKLVEVTHQQKIVMAIDTGYSDPTIIQILGLGTDNLWRTFARYRLTRIAFPEQAEIIDWLDTHYNTNIIGIDIGAGGGGVGITQDLQNEKRFHRSHLYAQKIFPVQFGEKLENIIDDKIIKVPAKSIGGDELVRLVTEGYLIFSELDGEGISEISRVSYQKATDGSRKYFISSDKVRGKASEDHIFASYLVFALTIRDRHLADSLKPKLVSPSWGGKR